MKKNIPFFFILVFVLFLRSGSFAQKSGDPWTSADLLDPAFLAHMLDDPRAEKPFIFNIGPLADITGAVKIGPTNTKAGLTRLQEALERVPKDKMVVIYCGCCPFRNCPNVRPAFSLLKEMKFARAKLLNLPQNLKVDWMDRGFPME